MRKLCVFLVIILSSVFNAYSQKEFATYQSELRDKPYSLEVAQKEGNEYSVYVNAYTTDSFVDHCGFSFDRSDHSAFISSLKNAKDKYAEWVKIAKENKVKDLHKAIEVETIDVMGFFYYGDEWNYDFRVKTGFEFRIYEGESGLKYAMFYRGDDMEASDNEFIECDDFLLAFYSAGEINEFIEKISVENVTEFLKKPNAEDLFK